MEPFQFYLFIFIASFIFSLKIGLQFFLSIRADNPAPMKLKRTEKILLLLAISYILTSIIAFFSS